MPKLIDYAGRFMFFEAATFALVRDHGVHSLSRHRVAKELGTSISTVRRASSRRWLPRRRTASSTAWCGLARSVTRTSRMR